MGDNVEVALYLFCLDHIDESVLVDIADLLDDFRLVAGVDDRVDDRLPFLLIAALAAQDRRAVMGGRLDDIVDLMRLLGHDEQRCLHVFLIQKMQHLRGDELVDDRIQRLVPAEDEAGCDQDDRIEAEHQVECIHPLLVGEPQRDEVGAARCRVLPQAQTDRHTVEQAAENADEQRVIGDDIARQKVNKEVRRHDADEREHREFLPDIPQPDVERDRVQDHIDHRIRQLDVQVHLRHALDQDREPCRPARVEPAGVDERVNVERHDHGRDQDQDHPAHVRLKRRFAGILVIRLLLL